MEVAKEREDFDSGRGKDGRTGRKAQSEREREKKISTSGKVLLPFLMRRLQ